jgi:transcriptional regulator with XRE-family HTH domain
MRLTESQAKQLGTTIAKARLRKGLSQRKLAIEVGMSPGWIEKLEQGVFLDPAPDRLVHIAEVLDIDPGFIDRLSRGNVSQSLPHIRTYFRAKYRMSSEEIERIERYVRRIYGGPS